MKSIFRNFSSVFIILICLSGCAAVGGLVDLPINREEVVSFNTVASDVIKLNDTYGENNVLIVLDIDNTLLTSSVDLGGDIWYQWQRGKLDIKPDEGQRVSCLFEDAIGLLYELCPMILTEDNLPEIIESWQSGGNTVIALTSRAPKYRAATERELNNKRINFETSALSPQGENPPVYLEKLQREYSYMNGIMMTSGMNKGEMLNFILEKTKRRFVAIVFVDDSEHNIVNVYNEFMNRRDIDTHIYHYVNIEKSRESEFGAVLTTKQAAKMAKDWVELNKTLNSIFPKRKLTEGCLSMDE
jgi:hypothetical protein